MLTKRSTPPTDVRLVQALTLLTALAGLAAGLAHEGLRPGWPHLLGFVALAAAVAIGRRRGAGWNLSEQALAAGGAFALASTDGSSAYALLPLIVALAVCRALFSDSPITWIVGSTLVGLSPAFRGERTEVIFLLVAPIVGCLAAARVFARKLELRLGRAEWAATHEPLTGVWNRQAFDARLASELERASEADPVALLAVDLDGFRTVNDEHGHGVGDQVLTETARRIDRAIPSGCFLARIGGDEFAVIVGGRDAAAVAERVITSVSNRDINGVWLGASVGIALATHPGVSAQEVSAAADEALYQAKREGKGRVVWADSGAVPTAAEADERKAVRGLWTDGKISMFVQPIADLRTGAIRSYEALARIDAGEGPAGPLPWLECAERVGLRDELEIAFLRSALDLYRRRPAGARLNVNLSPGVLDLPEARDLLDGIGDLHGLTLELTENAVVGDYDVLQRHLAPFLDRGLRLAVDDIGAGQANMQHVTVLAPRYLKLDRSLVAGLDRDPGKAALVEAMARYAEQVGSYLVAEGVETAAERDVLVRIGVPFAQGYFIGRPSEPWPAQVNVGPEPAPAENPLDPSLAVVGEGETAASVQARFAADQELTAAVIVDAESTVLGLITRHRMLTQIGSRYGFPLFGDKPALRLADRTFVAVQPGTPRREIVVRAMARALESRYDPVLFVDARYRLVGLCTIQEILEESNSDAAVQVAEFRQAA